MFVSGLENKVVVYTGAAGLIGRAACRALHANGACIAAIDTNITALEVLETEIKQVPLAPYVATRPDFLPISDFDSLNTNSIDACCTLLKDRFGKIDILINSLYPRTSDWHLKFEDIPFSSWQKNVDTHMNQYFLMCQRVGLEMKNRGSGNIINFSSIYGMVGPDFRVYEGQTHMTNPAAYSAIKGGISNLTRYLASYWGSSGIRVNAICPGGVFDNQPADFVRLYESRVPLQRMAKTQDIVGALLFLASDLSGYLNGVNLPVDGGWTCI